MGWVEDSGIGDFFSGAKDLASSALQTYGDIQKMNVQLAQTDAATRIAQMQASQAVAQSQAQAQWSAQMARYGIFTNNGADSLNSASLSTTIGNMQRMVAGQKDPTQELMLWLGVAGLALAWMQYVKR